MEGEIQTETAVNRDRVAGDRNDDRAAAVVDFLQQTLTSNPVAVAELEVRARAAGLLGVHQRITDAKLFKWAKAQLNIKSQRHGFGSDGVWFWALPAQASLQNDNTNANAKASTPQMGTGGVAHGQDHSRPNEVHSRAIGMADKIPLKPNIHLQWVEGAGRLQLLSPHPGVPAHRWGIFLNDVGYFIQGCWAERAAGFGWDATSLFGCHPGRPLDHLQGAGLLWRLRGGKINSMHADWAMIEVNGEQQVVHRRPAPANFALPWRRAI